MDRSNWFLDRLTIFSILLGIVTWLPLGLSGVPLDTPDGFLHLGWAVAWSKAIQAGWLWPTWSDMAWGGAGSHALLIYPPMFRLFVGIPLLAGIAPDQALSGSLLALVLSNAVGAALFAKEWLARNLWRLTLVLGAVLNPYFLVNIYVRGAWPEALAQGLLWWLSLGLVGLAKSRSWGVVVSSAALAGVILSNWNASLLTALIWIAAPLVVLKTYKQKSRWLLSSLLGLSVTLPFWLPALMALPTVRPPMPAGLLAGEFFGSGAIGQASFGRLLWIQAVGISLILITRWLGWGRRTDAIGMWGLIVAAVGLLLMLQFSEPAYEFFHPLKRIQFPWRWLSPTWLGALLWLNSVGSQENISEGKSRSKRIFLVLTSLASVGIWFDSLWRFRTNLSGHAPSHEEVQANRKLLACDPLLPCPKGVKALPRSGELSKRFAVTGDGRIALSGVPDYSPEGIPENSWNKRLAIFWLPNWPQDEWASFSGSGEVEMTFKSPKERRLVLAAETAGVLRVMQWADKRWKVLVKPANKEEDWEQKVFEATRDSDGWTMIHLEAGTWEVALRYVYGL